MEGMGKTISPEATSDFTDQSPENEDETRLDDMEHYRVEKVCKECAQTYTTSLLKNKWKDRDEALKSIEGRDTCGTCLNKDKIAAAAKQMNLRKPE